jgi:hypothetical protein
MRLLILWTSRIPRPSIYGSHLLILLAHILLLAIDTWRCYRLGQTPGMLHLRLFYTL